MKLFQVQSVPGSSDCSIEGKKNDYFLYEFCFGEIKESVTFKTMDFEDYYFYFDDEEKAASCYDDYAFRTKWDLEDDNGVKLIGSIE